MGDRLAWPSDGIHRTSRTYGPVEFCNPGWTLRLQRSKIAKDL